ncbi:MAG: hypothetical protein COB49_01590 [Alphaproteobacteria bacterium]|nr:MAG: hypothetical protein COB49_01590 [Alphaproteobacteria bacterium]
MQPLSDYFSFKSNPKAIVELDGLRAIAVLLVLCRHAVWPLYSQDKTLFPIGEWDILIPFLNGWIGVDLFFVLSGFLITYHLLKRGVNSSFSKIGQYLGGRLLRIIPAYFTVLALVVLGMIPLYQIAPDYLGVRIIYHLLFLQDYLPANIVVAFWSLGVEEKFYFLAPFLLLLAVGQKTPTRCYMLLGALVLLPLLFRAITAVLYYPEITSYGDFFTIFRSPFHHSFDGLAIGVFCAFLYSSQLKKGAPKNPDWAIRIFWFSSALLCLQLFGSELLGKIGWYQKIFQPLVLSLTFGGILMGAIFGGSPKYILGAYSLRVIARISYPLYLIHIPLLPLCLTLSGYQVGNGGFAFCQFLAVFFTLSGMAALFLHFVAEKPFLLLKDKMWSPPLKNIVATPD